MKKKAINTILEYLMGIEERKNIEHLKGVCIRKQDFEGAAEVRELEKKLSNLPTLDDLKIVYKQLNGLPLP